MSVEQYIKATTSLMAWKKFEETNSEMLQIIDRLKNENLSLIFDTSMFEGHIKHVLELQVKIEKMFIDKTPEEIAAEKASGAQEDEKTKYQLSQAQLERQKMVQHCFKLDLRFQAMRIGVAIIAMQVFLGGIIQGGPAINNNFIKKATLCYGRVLDIIFKLDHVDVQDNGKEYLNGAELMTDKRFLEKYEVIRVIWSDVADADQIQNRDWNSMMDAVQRDISQLFNDYKFKRLVKHIESTFKEQSKDFFINIDEIFYIDRYRNESLPWMEISKKIRTDI